MKAIPNEMKKVFAKKIEFYFCVYNYLGQKKEIWKTSVKSLALFHSAQNYEQL